LGDLAQAVELEDAAGDRRPDGALDRARREKLHRAKREREYAEAQRELAGKIAVRTAHRSAPVMVHRNSHAAV
jgi:hypothetical protein